MLFNDNIYKYIEFISYQANQEFSEISHGFFVASSDYQDLFSFFEIA